MYRRRVSFSCIFNICCHQVADIIITKNLKKYSVMYGNLILYSNKLLNFYLFVKI